MDRERVIKDGWKSTLATQPANLPKFELHPFTSVYQLAASTHASDAIPRALLSVIY